MAATKYGTISLALFEPHVQPHVPACDPEQVAFLIRQAAIEWCKRTSCWVEALAGQTVVDQELYTLTGPDNAAPFKLNWLKLVTDVGETKADCVDASVLSEAKATNDACLRAALVGSLVELTPAPASVADIEAEAVMVPTEDALTLPGMLRDHIRPIAKGALAEILAIKAADWYDPGLSAAHHSVFSMTAQAVAIQTSRARSKAKITGRRRTSRFL